MINGPIPVSADGEPLMGLAPDLDNFYVACGFTAGIAASGGAGLAMSQPDPARRCGHGPVAVRRAPLLGRCRRKPRYLEKRALEAYGAYYKIHWPLEEPQRRAGPAPLAAA